MRYANSSEFYRCISQFLCFSILLQTTGIAAALPLPPEKTFLTESELAAGSAGTHSAPAHSDRWSGVPVLLEDAWAPIGDGTEALKSWWRDVAAPPWGTASQEPRQIAQLGGSHPLPTRLMAALFAAAPAGAQSGPPSPGGLKSTQQESVSESELASLAEKVATEEIPLLPGFNLISLPEEPADTDPATVFAALGGQLEKVEAYDACDTADPEKVYDPADPAASDLTVVDHRMGLWMAPTVATVLPSDGTLPASTTIDLCVGWNLIGFPAGEARHPYTALSSIAGKWERIFGFDKFDEKDPWEVFDPVVPDWANDLRVMQPGRGYWLLVTEATTLEIRNQGPPPLVAISAPADLAVVTEPTEILGTVESDRLASWALSYRAIGDGEAVTLATGNTPVTEASFGTFDPTLLLNGLYELELTATDVHGQQVSESIAIAVEGQMKIGHFTLSFVDLAVPVSGLDIEVIRTYDSRDKRQGDFGVGWSLDIRQGSYRNNRPPGDGWQLQTGLLPCDTVVESQSHLTVVRLSDREVYRFALRLFDGASTGGGCFATARFDLIGGPLPGTTLEILGNDQVFYENGGDQVIHTDSFELYEPDDVRLTTRDGRIFDLNLDLGVTRVQDPNGNHLEFREEGVFHSVGKTVEFERDAEGRITKITDPADHEIAYAYDDNGDLVSTTDRIGNLTAFSYDADHRLVVIVDPRGVQALRSTYDSDGRLIGITDALGHELQLGHDLGTRREVITNRLGLARVFEYDTRGNVLRETDELGKVTVRAYDSKDRLLTEIDPLGGTTTNAYDGNGDLLSTTDPSGSTTAFTYDGFGNPMTFTDPRGKVTTNTYDSRGNVLSTTDRLAGVTAFTYDSQGRLLSEIDAAGNSTTFAYDTAGNLTRSIDALGTETTSTFDANGNVTSRTTSRTLPDGSTETLTTTFIVDPLGRVTATTAPDGATTSISYDPLGAVLSATDALGRPTAWAYDAAGRLTERTYPDGTAESRAYDAEGRVVAATDRGGRVTTFLYDAAGRLVTTLHADGTTKSSTYDDAGRIVASTDARGSITTFVLDAVGRRTQVINALGQATTYAYDAAGNQTAVTDGLGNSTSFTLDDAGSLLTTTFPDGTTASNEYDELGRRVAGIDQAGVRTGFGYDPLGRLVQVTDAAGGITRYTYDEQGNRTSQTDANGHVTRFTFDKLGRQTARILPGGAAEILAYDAAGNRISRTDFNGVTTNYAYDVNGRLTERSYPVGTSVSFTYTATGRRASATDARGVATYSYNDRDQLVSMTAPEGWTLQYSWDAAGNRKELTTNLGAGGLFTTEYSYDAVGRLATVTDARSGVYAYGYDAAGRRASLSYPNGVVTTYVHDAASRLVNLQTGAPDGSVIQSYDYTLEPTGNRQAVTEQDGTVRTWEYDDLYRLIREEVRDGDGALVYDDAFTYDPVGNRTQQVRTGSDGATATTVYAYDVRDRLLSEVVAEGETTTYGWDSNGNLISKATAEGTTGYGWDTENRLVSALLPDGTLIANTYDADGVRMAAAATAGGTTASTEYVTDTSGALSRVIAEVTEAGVLGVNYVRGGELLGLLRDGQERYVHADHLGSVRALTEPAAVIAGTYDYGAFGQLIEATGSDPNPFLFAGEQHDAATGLYNLRARWMDSSVGRFSSQDPFAEGSLGTLLASHGYVYGRNNPVNSVDPTGLFSISVSGMAAASAVFGVASAVFYGGAAYTRYLGAGKLANHFEGFARVLNGFAFILIAPTFGLLGLGALTAGVDELLVGAQQMLNGNRPVSPITKFLQKVGLSHRAASNSVNLLKLIFTFGPRSWVQIRNILAWAKNVKSGLSGLRSIPESLKNWLKIDASNASLRTAAWEQVRHLEGLEKYRALGGLWGIITKSRLTNLPGLLHTGPTEQAELVVDIWRSIGRLYTHSLDARGR